MNELEYWETQYLPGKNFGILILSTSKGVMTHEQARKEGVGGELSGMCTEVQTMAAVRKVTIPDGVKVELEGTVPESQGSERSD